MAEPGTLDLTKIRVTLAQLVGLAVLIGCCAVGFYRIGQLENKVDALNQKFDAYLFSRQYPTPQRGTMLDRIVPEAQAEPEKR